MILPDAEATFEVLLQKLKPLITDNTALVGIHSGGVWLVDRLLPLLGRPVARGTLDISFYRDDFDQRGLRAENKPSQIPFDVQDQHIILVDDVFHTGRTIRAAMNELFDYGRPASISLAVLVDRGGRELPIVPQIVAADIPLPVSQNLQLLQSEDGRFHFELKDSL
ncbi:bifunctional pyr operon transcriptional regulator/uracil phosphoribosyltransferase PyrR [Methylovorus glucosotrophus]|jgi:pyrimidine operon attenuation protein / uracil phosphoribosyltransferase|uniref:Uracil phosphoribosyltransferase n=1 Tax=Methylovorus glucosotrophus (strain SIP3-4) TaxID=582744 RepID=C6X9Q6_METGS|nr:bifunctional pyr operon transcriptional regulator/uracil phosphoribosyltransferase PyrR [Methylovorus glucosotrophus]ACT49876.1 Uracil phosphoribosyltransferase [Methylovorus glucosotrophus SIP3-4]KAF0836486.1 pyrimidine operon attenuation protein/uracil phosphoribosyltransferase [Methylovorus glucosotrophus]